MQHHPALRVRRDIDAPVGLQRAGDRAPGIRAGAAVIQGAFGPAAADVLAVSVQRDTAIGKEQGQDLVHRGAVTDTGRPPGARHAEAPHGLVFDPCPGPQDRAAGPNTVVEDFQCDLRGGIIR